MMWNADVDIDVKSHTKKSNYGIRAMKYNEDKKDIEAHPSGYYIDINMPMDPETGYAAIDYKEAEELGFVKVDLLTNSQYDGFRSKNEILEMFNTEPDWSLLQDENIVSILPQIHKHFELIKELNPQSIDDLADCLALIRPGKQKYISDYKRNKTRVRKNLYKRTKDGMYFKKSHAYAYAGQIICILNKLDSKYLFKFD